MTKQPEALRLADAIDPLTRKALDNLTCTVAAAELRRLYAEVDRLSYQLAYPDNFVKRIDPLTRPQINQMMADAGWQNSAIRQADLDKVEKVVRAIEKAPGIYTDK